MLLKVFPNVEGGGGEGGKGSFLSWKINIFSYPGESLFLREKICQVNGRALGKSRSGNACPEDSRRYLNMLGRCAFAVPPGIDSDVTIKLFQSSPRPMSAENINASNCKEEGKNFFPFCIYLYRNDSRSPKRR